MNKGYVYILQNAKSSYYIGSTNNISRRIEEHERGNTQATQHKGPWRLVFSQEYDNLAKARRVEYKLKHLKRKDIIERIIKEQKILMGG
jgi:putative endonuclease